MKRLLVLGAGLVSPPLIRYFLPRRDVAVVVASLDFSRIERLVEGHRGRVDLVATDVNDPAAVGKLVSESDAVVSLLPAHLLPAVSRIALAERRSLVSTSYAGDEVRVLDQAARDAGVLLLNECGFDPGIDHMTAVRTIRRFESRGARVTQFTSAAAGLPAPEANTNPWQYKFSWNPRAAILAARRDARFLRSGRIIEVAGSELHRYAAAHEVDGLGTMEMYPNRDSLFYRDLYGLSDATDVFRGTLRYPGWMETIAAAARLGLLDETTRSWPVGTTWRDIAGRKLEGVDARAMERLRWAGFFSDEPIGRTSASALDLFVSRLEGILQYERGERDMALLQHRFEATFSDGTHERIEASLVTYGEANGDTAMSRLVGLPAAIAADLVLRRRIELTGVQIPVAPAIYEPLLEELEGQGVTATERKI